MTTAGLYETSGDWLYDVGLPGKSGIGGGIVTVSPGQGRARHVRAAARRAPGTASRGSWSRASSPAGSASTCSSRSRSRSVRRLALARSPRSSLACRRGGRRPRRRDGARARSTPRSCGSSSSRRSAGRASRTSRWTSTRSSTSRRSRCAARGTRPTSSRSRPTAADLAGPLRVPPRLPRQRARPGLRLRALGAPHHRGRPSRRSTRTSPPIPAGPGKLALQYWLFYAYNDWNNLHEGDWEMIQLVFDADDARGGARERARRGRLQPARGRRARRLGRREARARRRDAPGRLPGRRLARELLRRGAAHRQLRPSRASAATTRAGRTSSCARRCSTIPSDPAAARAAFPWIGFEGRWGELQEAFFNGPTGPNLKTQWTEPIRWSEDWRDRSYAVPTGGVLGTGATDFFCDAVGSGSRGAGPARCATRRRAARARRARSRSLLFAARTHDLAAGRAAPRSGAAATWGQILSAAGRMYVERAAALPRHRRSC